MTLEPQPNQEASALAKVLPFTSVALVIALLYVAWTFYSRHETAREQAAKAAQEEEQARHKQAEMLFGEGEVKFLQFSAAEGHLKRGQSTQLCYGMVNAVSVQIDPGVGEAPRPTSRHCVDIAPQKTTKYTITATNAKGKQNSTSLVVQVE